MHMHKVTDFASAKIVKTPMSDQANHICILQILTRESLENMYVWNATNIIRPSLERQFSGYKVHHVYILTTLY